MSTLPRFTFTALKPYQEPLVLEWLEKPHVAEWWHGQGLQNTIQGIKSFVTKTNPRFDAWIGYADGTPFAFLITFTISPSEAESPESQLAKWVEADKKTITLDLLIGEEAYLGKGLATPLITHFLDDVHPDADVIFIDPEKTNTKAIHVYEKAGFKSIDEFIASWHPTLHLLMRFRR